MTPYPPLKVERDMPFAKKGEILNREDNGNVIIPTTEIYNWEFLFDEVQQMIKDGWLSEVVEEKGLVEKTASVLNIHGFEGNRRLLSEEIVKLSNDAHLEAFDRATEKLLIGFPNCENLRILRKALEEVVK